MSYRIRVQEIDLSGFITQSSDETGAIVIQSKRGAKKPKKIQGEANVLLNFSSPDAKHFGVFEAILFCQISPAWIVSAIGANSFFGGIDIRTSDVVPFGNRTGRNLDTFNDYTTIERDTTPAHAAGTGNGINATFGSAGPLENNPNDVALIDSIKEGSLVLKVGGTLQAITDAAGALNNDSGSTPLDSSGTINYADGNYAFTFEGTPGTKAKYTTKVDDGAGNEYDLSGGLNKAVDITVDGVTIANIDLGISATASKASIIIDINSAIDSVLGGTNNVAVDNGNFFDLIGLIGSTTTGEIIISDPSNTITYQSGLLLVFDTAATSPIGSVDNGETTSADPTGSIPKAGQTVTIEYIFKADDSLQVSHSFFASSPYSDDTDPLAVKVEHITGKKYKLTLYEVLSIGNSELDTYEYSLIREKDAFGKSLYIFDVFEDDPFLIPFINDAYVNEASPTIAEIQLNGGERGDDPQASDFLVAWQNFHKANRYPVKILLDVYGNSASNLETILKIYQPYAFGITMVPLGNSAASAKTFRQGLGINYDNMAIYTNWARINDPYNNSSAWTSQIGKVAVKYALMGNVFDALSPAGIDENNHGGLLFGFRAIEMENDYDDTDLKLLDEAQINPILHDPILGPIIDGDRTLQVINSDTSFIGTRRLYNHIIQTTITQVLRRQKFKLNDAAHRFIAKALTDSIISPILANNFLSDTNVICNTTNNNKKVLNQRKFIIDIVVKVTPNSQFVILRLTRLSQTQSVAEFLPQAA